MGLVVVRVVDNTRRLSHRAILGGAGSETKWRTVVEVKGCCDASLSYPWKGR